MNNTVSTFGLIKDRIYKIKMLFKRIPIVKGILKHRDEKANLIKIEALKTNGKKMIEDVENILKDTDLIYFASCGTLLGIVREKGFINGDNDVDYSIELFEGFDWDEFENMFVSYGFKKIRQFELDNKIKEQTYLKNGLTVDFFTDSKINNDMYSYGFYRKENYLYSSPYEYSVREIKVVKVEATMKVDFLGTKVTIPRNYEEILMCIYGANWRIPNPNWDDNSTERKNMRQLDTLAKVQFFE